jgi:ribosomal protein S2
LTQNHNNPNTDNNWHKNNIKSKIKKIKLLITDHHKLTKKIFLSVLTKREQKIQNREKERCTYAMKGVKEMGKKALYK